jgi:hypothetical protein
MLPHVSYHCSAKQSLVPDHSWVVDPCHLAPSACNADGHLTRLALPALGLTCGGFPAQLGGLKFLQRLDLSGNNLEGATLEQVAEVRASVLLVCACMCVLVVQKLTSNSLQGVIVPWVRDVLVLLDLSRRW